MGKKIFGILLVFIVLCSNVFAQEFTRDNYYVKIGKSGFGDGSSWENAMSATSFAKALSPDSKLKSGVTFHLAAGVYYPESDPYFELHKDYPLATRLQFKAYYIQTPINIVGGYSENPTDNESPDPINHKTIISGDLDGDDQADLLNLFCVELKEKAQCSFFGLTFTKTTNDRYNTHYGALWLNGTAGTCLKLEKCTMTGLSNEFHSSIDIDEADLTDCYIEESAEHGTFHYFNKLNMKSCSFVERSSSFNANYLYVQNCTFCQSETDLFVYKDGLFHNNTIVQRGYFGSYNGFSLGYGGKMSLVGNIFESQVEVYKLKTDDDHNIVSNYNLYCGGVSVDEGELISGTDYKTVERTDILQYELTYDKSNYTPYFKLLKDELSEAENNHSVHFDLNMTSVSTDQRGVQRTQNTCMGAYEKIDTIYVGGKRTYIWEGESINGKKYTKYGVYNGEIYNTINSKGYACVAIYTLFVKPKDKRTNFYVKTDGTGDGSSWEKAMSPTDFAWRMLLSETIDTFHVAEGTYYPPLVENSRVYERSMPVCIIGGYPKNSTSLSQEPDPVKHKTIFSVDFNNDNTYEDDRIINIDEDGFTIFSYIANKSGKCLISGIVFDGGTCDRNCPNAQCQISDEQGSCEFTFEQCEFRRAKCRSINCNAYSERAANNVLNINNCYFNRVGEYYYHYPVQCEFNNVNFNACTFEDLSDLYIYSSVDQTVSYSNCTFFNCSNIIFEINSSSRLNLNNNTICSSTGLSQINTVAIDYPKNVYMTGNIIYAIANENSEIAGIHSNYNVYYKQSNLNQIKSENDIVVEDCSFLDSKLSQVDNVITPVLVMTSDTLPDGTSLRFPLFETNVTMDQRKWNRYRMTSVGSYEAECQKDSSYLTVTDTIYAGDVYMGKRFVEVGLNYGIDTLHNTMGCDSLIYHPVYVLPERTIPTAFTPSDLNKKNDVFMQGHEVYIYDIYGKLICHSENGWDGMINDERANPGIYVYAVKTYSGEMKRGTVELLIQQ